MTGTPDGVGATALLTAYARAEESQREDRLFNDPWARWFVGDGNAELPPMGMARVHNPSQLWVAFRDYFIGRTPFYDERIMESVRGGTRQVVLLAAGMDSRAFRLGLPPDVTVYEVDTAPVLNFKNSVLDEHGATPTCERICVAADLREPWTDLLIDAGLDTAGPVVWVVEGLLMYLTPEESDRLLATITEHSAAGSRLLSEYPARLVDEQTLLVRADDGADRDTAKMMATLVRSGPGVEPAVWLQRFGWTPSVTDIATQITRQGRPVPSVFSEADDRVPVWLLAGSRMT